ncbi:MAG: DNA (cytosine-5-)-methyltransferase [Candidatus Dadabacteria bacterium]|nr:DNA (cytosine-5-)-methyltransferase [Candidatus Dadabacteria bacterium]
MVNADITEICNSKDPSLFPFNNHHQINTDIVLGGFPCQDFSHAGRRKGLKSERGALYRSMAKVVQLTNPLVFVAENVQGLLTIDRGKAIKTIINNFEDLGYHVVYKLLIAADYGVPQTRKRVFIIGTKRSKLPPFEYPKPPNKNKWITLREAIGDLETVREGELPNHYWSKAKKNKGQGNNILDPDKPGPTMRTEHHGNIEFHWNGKRRLSAREAARIQSFPDDFIFYPSTSQAYKQIGNAVPPVLAWYLATSIEEFLNVNLHS